MLHSSSVFRQYYGGSTPSGFDCSGFTSYVFKNTVGSIRVSLRHSMMPPPVFPGDDLLPGDLVFFGSSTSSIQPCRHLCRQ